MHLAEFNRVRQPYSISLAMVTAVLVCTSCGIPQDVQTGQDTASAVSSASGSAPETTSALITLGEFNADNDEFELFNPCTEISREVYEAVGFVEAFGEPRYDFGGSIACSFKSDARALERAVFTVTADEVPFQRLVDRDLVIDEAPISTLPGVYTHHLGSSVVDSCVAAVHTISGRLTILISDRNLTDQRDALCEIAVQHLEKIHAKVGGV